MTLRHVGPLLLLASSLGCGADVDLGGAIAGDAHVEAGPSTCSSFAPPDATAACVACKAGSKGCPTLQPNGCYGGYFCDTSGEPDCKEPGTPCSDSVKFDAH